MVHISSSSIDEDPTVKDVTYSGFSMQRMRKDLESSIEKFWECVQVRSNDYKIKEETENINNQRIEFLGFIEYSIQQSHEIRKYVSNLQLIIKDFSDLSISDENFNELESLLDDTKRNKQSAEKLRNHANNIKDELVKIRNDLHLYRNDIQTDPNKIKSKTKDDLDAFLLQAAIAGIVGGTVAIGSGAGVAIKAGIKRPTKKAKKLNIKEKLEEEKKDLSNIIEQMVENLDSIVITIGYLVGYWETQSSLITGLLEKVTEAINSRKLNKLLIRVMDKCSKELELDELYAKDFCVTIRGLLAKDQTRSQRVCI
ncbi:9117_t:CDS:2 [Gigaspora margarita]|uniref:9117_t:CDS:1 n=1 Tax=Gigaspora margarita TaxID=4874 RepID=A0ABN7VBN8_GIGMA|nr:9117_t:CDS:2 [Gigaspora margarita]